MKTDFATEWKASKQPRKQRKYRYNAPIHIQKKFLGCHLSKELRKYGRSITVRKGDKVKVMRGQFKGKVGTVERVSVKHTKVYIQGIETKKRDGSKALFPLNPSNIMITELNLEDKKRTKTASPKTEAKKVEKTTTAPKAEVKKTEEKKAEKPAEKKENKE